MPKRKIYDIKHPRKKKEEKLEKNMKEFFVQEPVKRSPRKTATAASFAAPATSTASKSVTATKEKKSAKRYIFLAALVVLLGIGGYLYVALQKVDVTIWPTLTDASYTQDIAANTSAQMVDVTKSIIPAQLVSTTKTESEDFPATGSTSSAGKATGTITLTNKLDPAAPLTLKPGTHFMSDGGKLFVSTEKVILPAAKKSGSKVVPGTVQVAVEAQDTGSDYNIPASSFSVPGLKGTNYYYAISGTSSDAMVGGSSGVTKQVTSDDISGAKDIVSKKVTDEANAALQKQIGSDSVLLTNASTATVTIDDSKAKSGATVPQFTLAATAKVSGLVFKKADIDEFVKEYVISQVADGQTLLESSVKEDYSVTSMDATGGSLKLHLTFSAQTYQEVNKNSLTLSFLGQNGSEIRQTITSSLGNTVSKVSVNFWPFWVSTAPQNQEKVHVYVKFN